MDVPATITWPHRAKRETRNEHRRRIWRSRCGRYRVVYSACLLGADTYAPRYYAQRRETLNGRELWETLSTHWKRGPALEACRRDLRTKTAR